MLVLYNIQNFPIQGTYKTLQNYQDVLKQQKTITKIISEFVIIFLSFSSKICKYSHEVHS